MDTMVFIVVIRFQICIFDILNTALEELTIVILWL